MDRHDFLASFSTGHWNTPADEPWHSLVTANNFCVQRNPLAAIKVLDEMPSTEDHDTLRIKAVVRVRANLQLGRAEQSVALMEAVDVESVDIELRCQVLLNLGIAYRLTSRTEQALSCLSVAKSLFTELNLALPAAVCQVEIGSLLLEQGDVGAATACYISALDDIEEHGTTANKVGVRMNLAAALQRSGNTEGAEREYRLLLTQSPFDKPGNDRAQLLQSLASAMKISGKYQQALDLYEEALNCIEFDASPALYLRIRVGIAELAFRVGDIVTADEHLNAIEKALSGDSKNMVSVEYLSLRSRVHGLSGRFHEAQELLSDALSEAIKGQLVDEQYLLLRESLDWVFGPMRMKYLEDLIRIQDRRNEQAARGVTALIDLRARFEQEKSVREIERQQEITRTVLDTQTRLFEEIGRDIHDSVGQDLTVLRLMTERLTSGQFPQKEIQEIHTRMHEIVRRVEHDTRRISHLVSGMGCTGIGLRDALTTIKNDISKGAANLDIELVISSGLENISDEVARTILRCAQTLLQNILRHSHANSCIMQLLVHSGEIVFSVEDNGVGFDRVRAKKGLGLRELFARTDLVGGSISIDSAPGHGTFVEITIPRKDIE